MISVLAVKTKGRIINNPHFWAVILLTLALIFVYQAWPWREWKFTQGVWQWFPWLSSLGGLVLVELKIRIVGVLFLAPIIYAAVFFSWRGVLFISLLSLVGVIPIIADMWSVNSFIINIASLLLPFFVLSIATFELDWRRKERELFKEREAERQLYISKLLEFQEKERRRIAQELHDEIIQTLLVIANRAHTSISSDDGDMTGIKRNLEWIRDTSLQTVEEIRRISLDLRPSVLDDLGLVSALRWLVDRTSKESSINIRMLVNGVTRKLNPEAEIVVFRLVQEALNNIKRHSGASEAVITLEFVTEYLKVRIEDDGQGFHPPRQLDELATKGKLGLIGMKQRVDFLCGTLQIRSEPGRGTVLLAEVKC